MNRYFKNFILCGDIDQYCLLCKETFQLIPDIEKHIRWEQHRKSAKNLTYFKKFQKDFIYKIGTKFYCEVCNKVVPHISSVKDHIKTERHLLLKTNPDAEIKKPVGMYIAGDIVINKKVLLVKQDWHTITADNMCLLCNVEVTDIDAHIALEDHIVGLIQSETSYTDDRYYRKINEDAYHCFACKTVFKPFDLAKHWSNCINTDEITVQKFKEPKSIKDIQEVMDRIAAKSKAEQEIYQTFEDYYLMDYENHVCICRFCYSSLVIDYKFKTMIQHLRAHILNKWSRNADSSSDESITGDKPPISVVDHGKKRAECAAYGRSHFIKLNYNGSKGYCYMCDKYLTLSKTTFRQHCKGLIHSSHRELFGMKKSSERTTTEYTSQSLRCYMTRMRFAPEKRTVLVNDEMIVQMNHFFFLQPIKNNPHWMKTKCFCCNIVIKQGEEREHCLTIEHKDNFLAAKVISKKGEFVREIRPNLFHCGFCNVTLPYANVLERHLQSKQHRYLRIKDIPILELLSYWRDLDMIRASTVSDVDLYVELLHSFY